MVGLEFGSGRSTVWLADRLAGLTSVEHDGEWYRKVAAELAARGASHVDYRYVPLDHPLSEGERETYDPLPRYVAVAEEFPNHSLDVVIVDGHYRTHCVRSTMDKLKPGGFLVVDDVNLWPSIDSLPVPADWTIVDESSNGLKRAIVFQAPAIDD